MTGEMTGTGVRLRCWEPKFAELGDRTQVLGRSERSPSIRNSEEEVA